MSLEEPKVLPGEQHPPVSPLDSENDTLNEPETEPKGGDAEHGKSFQCANPLPDGGVTAWLVVLGGWCALFCTFGWINSRFLTA